MSTLTATQEQQIAAWLAAHPKLSVGVGTDESACSIAAINLALTGQLTDTIPPCMSRVIGRWIMVVQDAMNADIRNSEAWRDLLPLAAGTGRKHEQERKTLVLSWMWDALAIFQPVADRRGYGEAWRRMTTERTGASAKAAYAAADADAAAYAAAAADADAYAYAAADAAVYAAAAADPYAAASAAFWRDADPVGCLRRLVAVTDARAMAGGPQP